jgi:hypothetical protein
VGTGTDASCTQSALNACLPGGTSFDGTVTFNCGGAATIIVTSTKTISADTAIDGGSLITISGGNSVGVFSVNTGVKFTVQNLTIANGSSAGGYGGGIYNIGALTVTNSTFSRNSATGTNGYGGGIFNYGGTLTVTNSTFAGNSATGTYGGGGGIDNYSGTLTVTNSTFAGNSAGGDGGGAISNGGTLTVINSTFSGNSAPAGGSITNVGTMTLTNTIVANTNGPLGANCTGSVTDGGHNIDDGTTCGFSTANGSLNNTNPAGLVNHGGPTQTIALQAGSPAVNAGDESVCAAPPVKNLDQRGYVRPGAGVTSCSIGAFEYNSVPRPPAMCSGDCNGDGQVTVDEILTMVSIALGNTPVTACDAGDANQDNEITVDEILTAVNNALNGCPVHISGAIRYYGNGVPVPGVVVELAELKGATTLSTQTDANGQFAFDAVSSGSWQVQPAKMGGAEGAIDISDAVQVLNFSVGQGTPNPGQQLGCDVSGDGTITEDDEILIGQYTVGLLTRFPVADACGSDWIFVPVPSAAVNQSVTQPLFSGGPCRSGSITFDPLSADAVTQDIEAI